jgi:broad-specificity NMP kinase
VSNYFRIGICGEPGSGKTTIIKTIRKDARILILNTEGGLNSIAGYLELNKQNITVRDIRAYDDISKLKKYQESDIKDFDYIDYDDFIEEYETETTQE